MTLAAIWAGDLLRSVHVLAPASDGTRGAIAELLGFERVVPGPPPVAPWTPPPVPPPAVPAAPAAAAAAGLERLPAIAPRPEPGIRAAPVTLLQLTAVGPESAPRPIPLLSPLASRFIAQELVTSSRFGPDPDLGRLVDALARGEIPQPVPLREHRTLARGVQVLVDHGEGMEPFAADQEDMVEVIRRLAGEDLVEVRIIREAPDAADPVAAWVPPRPGVPVLALTDLGLGGRVERGAAWLAGAWQLAAGTLAARGSDLVALVPYPADRWPAPLAAGLSLAFWDRSTTAAGARRARRARRAT